MNQSSHIPISRDNLAPSFEGVFQKLHALENPDIYAKDLSLIFETLATQLLAGIPGREGCYFDGVVGLTSSIKSQRKIQFEGEMWVGRDRLQWTEIFRATTTDKRSTKQGIWVVIWIGDDRVEAELSSVLGRRKSLLHDLLL